jgi:hypothetical protein
MRCGQARHPEQVQVIEPDMVPVAGLAATALRKVNFPEPSARKVTVAVAVAASGSKVALPTTKLPPAAKIEALPYVPGPWYGETSAVKYTGLPIAGAGIWKLGWCRAGTGVPRAASRAHELAGLVTPGNAVNDACRVFVPPICNVPVKLISPGMAWPLAALSLDAPPGPLDRPAAGDRAAEDAVGDGPEAGWVLRDEGVEEAPPAAGLAAELHPASRTANRRAAVTPGPACRRE